MAVTRIQNNQIFDQTITYAKIAPGTLVGSLFNANLTLNSNVTIQGNLAVVGESTTISSTNTYVNDPLIVFNNGYVGTPLYDIGIVVNRNLNPINTAWIWNESSKRFEGIYTTETGGTLGSINNSGFANLAVGNATATTAAIANLTMVGDTISTIGGDLILGSASGDIVVSSNVIPNANNTLTFGNVSYQLADIYTANINVGSSTISSSGGNLMITPSGGSTIVSNLIISGSGSTFSGNIASSNVNITGGTINGTVIGGVTPAAGTFTSMSTANAQVTGGAITSTPISGSTGSFTSMSTANAQVTGGAITSTPISGSTGSFTSMSTANAQVTGGAISGASVSATTLTASGAFVANSTATLAGITDITNTTQSTAPTNGALIVAGGVGVGMNVNVGGNVVVSQTTTMGNITVGGNSITSVGNVDISGASVVIGALTMPQVDAAAGSVMTTNGAGVISLQPVSAAVVGNIVPLGTPLHSSLTGANLAVNTFSTTTAVTDAIDDLNVVLGKLVPPAPPAFPNGSLAISGLSSGLRMTAFTQVNNTTTGSKQLAAGSTVSAFSRSSSYSTNTFTNVGPGESGNVSVMLDGVVAGTHTMVPSLTNNGTYGNLVISNNVDYGTIDGRALLFWNSFDASASGTVPAGWNEVYLTDTAAGTTNTPVWYFDASAPGTPVVTVAAFTPTTVVTANSSSIAHYTSSTVFTASGTANKLSGDLYPATDTFLTGSAGGQFQTPASVTYTAAGVTTPLAQNLYVVSGSASYSTTANTVNATGSSSSGPSISVNNSYSVGSATASPGATVLTINTADTSTVNENNIVVGTFGTGGSASAIRAGGFPSGATPVTSGATAWNSSTALPTYEGTVVAGVAKYDITNYSVGYLPVGPDLSVGRTATQYMTFRIQRDSVSKFNIAATGKVSGVEVALPGSSIDTTALPTNGWINPAIAYLGSGVPGTGTGGNGSVGCSIGGTFTVGATLTQSITVTFGTESSHNSTNNYIYVRFALNAGDNLTALSFVNPTN